MLRAAYAVACAGAHGEHLRQLLGLRFGGQSFGDLFLICDIRTGLPGWARERRFYFDPPWNPGRQVLIHPCPDSTFRMDWQVQAGFDEAPGARHDRIRKIIGDRPYELVWSSVYRFSSRVTDRMRVGRVLLAGDVAHQLSPFGARGLNSGVQDAENAAWKIAFVLRGWAPEALLDSYHAERHAAACENLEVTSATMRFLVPATDAERRHRVATLEAAVADPAAWPRVDSGRLAEPFWYTASPLTTPDPARPFQGRPARGAVPPPGPGILVPEVPIFAAERSGPGTLRAVARTGFVLLCASGADVAAARSAAEAVAAPVRVLDAAALPDSGAGLAAAGLAAPGEVWVIRPDAHAAAVLHDPGRAEIVRGTAPRPGPGGGTVTWLDLPPGTGFGIANLPFGIFSRAGPDEGESGVQRTTPIPRPPAPGGRVGVAIGDSVLDVAAVADDLRLPLGALFAEPALNRFLAAGPAAWREARERITEWLTSPAHRAVVRPHLVPPGAARLHLPFAVADYVDF